MAFIRIYSFKKLFLYIVFWPPSMYDIDIFYLVNVDKKSTFLDYVPTHLFLST